MIGLGFRAGPRLEEPCDVIPYPKDITIRRGDSKRIFCRIRERLWDPSANGGLGGYVPGDYRDLTGWVGKAQVRTTEDSATVVAEFTVTLSDQTATPGGVTLYLAPATTAGITVDTAKWDFQFTDAASDVWTYAAGAVTIVKDVTR
jgi:hypothetical protein